VFGDRTVCFLNGNGGARLPKNQELGACHKDPVAVSTHDFKPSREGFCVILLSAIAQNFNSLAKSSIEYRFGGKIS
jgi:hypothetical protein